MTTTPDNPTAVDLLADANTILAQTFVTTGPMGTRVPAAQWQHRYRQWLAKQNHPARGGAV